MAAVQTFLPFPRFDASAAVLDDARLGKQRVETLQVLRALVLEDYGWAHHPAVRDVARPGAGAGRVRPGLRPTSGCGAATPTARPPRSPSSPREVVGLDQDELEARRPDAVRGCTTRGSTRSHRAALLRKDPARYAAALDDGVDPETPYLWPGPRRGRGHAAGPAAAMSLWVVRPPAAGVLGRFLAGRRGRVWAPGRASRPT